MGFKIIKEQEQEKQFCDYVQNKIDIAKKFNARYELVDEDMRIQKLYDDGGLRTSDRIKSLSRIKKVEDGEECLLISKDVIFTDKLSGIAKDRYSTIEGLTELPLKATNEDGVTESNQVKLEYSIPFTKAKVLEAVKRAGSRMVKLRFFEGPETGNRVPRDTPIVGNLDYFINATWEELLLGREKKVVSSRINKLSEVRNDANKYDYATSIDSITTHEETNKPEEQNNIEQASEIPVKAEPKITTVKAGAASKPLSASSTGVKLKVSNTTD